MSATREKPKIEKTLSSSSPPKSDNEPWGCVGMLLTIVIGYFIVYAFSRVTTNTGTKIDQVICLAALIFFAVIFILAMVSWTKKSIAKDLEKKEWIKGCTVAETDDRGSPRWDMGRWLSFPYVLVVEP